MTAKIVLADGQLVSTDVKAEERAISDGGRIQRLRCRLAKAPNKSEILSWLRIDCIIDSKLQNAQRDL